MKKRIKKVLFAFAVAFFAVGAILGTSLPAYADSCTGVLPESWCDEDHGLQNMIQGVINILSGLVLVIAVGFISYSGFIWMTALDDAAKVAKAKTRILEIVIGLLVYFLLAIVIKFLVIG